MPPTMRERCESLRSFLMLPPGFRYEYLFDALRQFNGGMVYGPRPGSMRLAWATPGRWPYDERAWLVCDNGTPMGRLMAMQLCGAVLASGGQVLGPPGMGPVRALT